MKARNATATFYVPDGLAEERALARCTHLAIGAHQDDLEFMALHGILACFDREDRWFGGVTCTDGGGSPRTGPYEDTTDAEMVAIRREEQDRAARIGRYAFQAQLGWPSARLRRGGCIDLARDLAPILEGARPEIVYTHSPTDRHETHVAVTVAVVEAIRAIPSARRPRRLLGCEAWGSLDWLEPDDRVVLDVGGNDALARELVQVFDSQVAGGKRYDLAVEGRRRANATFANAHAVDEVTHAWLAMDLTALISDGAPALTDFVSSLMARFSEGARRRLSACLEERRGA